MVLIGAVRVLGALPVLRWPFAGALVAIAVDLSDLVFLNLVPPGARGRGPKPWPPKPDPGGRTVVGEP